MSDSGPNVMICYRVADRRTPAAPSECRRCGHCGAAVWVSKGGLRIVERVAARIACMRCAVALGLVKPDEGGPAPAPEQLPEILDALANLDGPDEGGPA
jgi:hypothetical protein